MEIISVNITQNIFDEADRRNNIFQKKFGNTGTHRLNKGRQRMTGYLAEACIRSRFPILKYSDDPNIDFILYDSITIDSKAQGCNSKPSEHYVATLYEEQKLRNVDYYIFSRVKNDFTIAWICGIVSKEYFLNNAKLVTAGTVNNNFTYDQSRYEMQYNQLNDITQFFHNKYENI